MWKDIGTPIGCPRELYLQALDKDDPIVDIESQTALIVRPCNGSLSEIVVDELTVQNLKAKVSETGICHIKLVFSSCDLNELLYRVNYLAFQISEISNIPEEHLVLGSQTWGSLFNTYNGYQNGGTYSCSSGIDWTSMTNDSAPLDQWPLNLREEGHVINYK